MPLLAVLANPRAEARAMMRTHRSSISESLSRLLRMSPRARREISSALRTAPLKVDVSGARGEFVRFRMKPPVGYQSYALTVLAPKHLRGMTPTEARKRLGTPGLRRLTLGVIGRRGPGKSELQSVLVPKSRVSAVTAKYLHRAVANRCCTNPKSCRHNNPAVVPMIAGGVAAGVAGAVANRLLRNPSKSVRTFSVPAGCEAKVASMLRSAFIWAKATDGGVMTLARPEIVKRAIKYVRSGKPLPNGGNVMSGIAPDGTKYVVKKNTETGEWMVVAYVKGKRHEGKTYYTTDKADAVGTFYKIVGRQVGHVEIGGPKGITFDIGGVRFNRCMKNPGRSYSELVARKKAEYGSKFDTSDLDPKYIPYFESGKRITVDFGYEVKRGTVGVTTGWKPVFLLMLTRRSIGSSHLLTRDTRILGVVRNCGKNAPRRRVLANRATGQTVINVPFRQGRKYSVAQVARWVEANGTPAMKKRFMMAMAQYKRFHKGSMPKFITYSQYKMGSHPGISDVEFGVSEGREWMAAYQVPRSSGKWMDQASSGRYVHAHGDSDIDVDVKRPVKLSKLPMRFHTPDGKAVGVIPSKNVKIGEWYEG